MTILIRCILLALATLPTAQAADDDVPEAFPGMAPAIGELIEEKYYDKARFRPRLMVERALRFLESSEVAIDTIWAGDKILLNLKGEGDRIKISAPEPSDLAAAMALIEAVRVAVDGAFEGTPKRLRLLDYALLNGALSTLDPHTVLWPPEAAKEFDEESIKGQFYGIGAFLNQDEGLISIQRVMPGLPADRAGVEDGDMILAIDGEKSAGLTLEQAVRRIKGPKGTTVNLSMERKGVKTPIEIPIVRDLVKLISIRQVRDGDVGYIRMDDFNANTAHDLYQAIRELEAQTPVKGLVLDLRYNGGGLLDQAKVIGGFFLGKKQEVVRTTTINGKSDIYSSQTGRLVTAPMIVMVSPGTASAAEIVSGALQLNERALIAGEATFGKGSVQNIHGLQDNSRLKLTIQEYLLPGGISIQDTGVVPDLRLARHAVRQDATVDLRDMSYERERDHEFALGSHNNYRNQVSVELSWLDPWLEKEARRRHVISAKEFVPDREAQLVIDLLKESAGAEDWSVESAKALAADQSRMFLLQRLKQPIAKRAEVEAAALADALGRLPQPVRWGSAQTTAKRQIAVTWTGPSAVVAGEHVALTIQVANAADTEVGRLFAIIRADPRSPFWEEEFIVGAVPAQAAVSGTLHLQIPPRLPDGEERFTIEVFQDGGKDVLASTDVVVNVTGRPSPHLGVAWRVQEPSGDGQLAPGEDCELKVDLFNDGSGPLEAGTVWLDKDNDAYVSLGLSRIKIDKPIPPGGTFAMSFPFSVNKELKRGGTMRAFPRDRIAINISVAETFADEVDARFRATVRAKAEIMVGAPLKAHRFVQPTISVINVQTENNRVRIRFQIADQADDALAEAERPAPLKQVALFQDEDKVDLQPARALEGDASGPWIYTPRQPLKPGLNRFRLMVSDSDGLISERVVRLWGAVAEATVVKPATLPSPENRPKDLVP